MIEFEKSAHDDIRKSKRGIIAKVDTKKSPKYHYAHIKIESKAVKKMKGAKEILLKHHREGHVLALLY